MSKRIQYYQNLEKIIKAGSLEKRMYIIMEGTVTITLVKKNESITVATLKKGDFFGEISLFTSSPRSADVIAQGDVKVAFVESVDELNKFLIKNPSFAAKMVYILSKRLAKTNDLLMRKINEINKIKLMQDYYND